MKKERAGANVEITRCSEKTIYSHKSRNPKNKHHVIGSGNDVKTKDWCKVGSNNNTKQTKLKDWETLDMEDYESSADSHSSFEVIELVHNGDTHIVDGHVILGQDANATGSP